MIGTAEYKCVHYSAVQLSDSADHQLPITSSGVVLLDNVALQGRAGAGGELQHCWRPLGAWRVTAAITGSGASGGKHHLLFAFSILLIVMAFHSHIVHVFAIYNIHTVDDNKNISLARCG